MKGVLLLPISIFFLFGETQSNLIYLSELSEIPESSIISKIHVASRFQCSHRCNRNVLCSHIGYVAKEKLCVLINSDSRVASKIKASIRIVGRDTLGRHIDPKG